MRSRRDRKHAGRRRRHAEQYPHVFLRRLLKCLLLMVFFFTCSACHVSCSACPKREKCMRSSSKNYLNAYCSMWFFQLLRMPCLLLRMPCTAPHALHFFPKKQKGLTTRILQNSSCKASPPRQCLTSVILQNYACKALPQRPRCFAEVR